jgi:MscS family membrane protein
MNENVLNERTDPPQWLPEYLEGLWELLATYPPVLALFVVFVGIGLAVMGRAFVLTWGGKLALRISPDLGPRLLRIVANVAALILAYLAVVVAIQIIGLPSGSSRC